MTDKETASSPKASDTTGHPAKPLYTVTHRLSHIPASFTLAEIRKLFDDEDQENIRDPISLADSVYMTDSHEKVATITFSTPPKSTQRLVPSASILARPLVTSVDAGPKGIHIYNHFEGLTLLNDLEPQSVIAE
jgi:hypothetical protein